MNLYEPLYHHLITQQADAVCMSFGEVEHLIGQKLPPTARSIHARQWWANTDSHVQGQAWLKARRKAKVDVVREQVTFRRIDRNTSNPSPSTPSASPERLELSRNALEPAAIRLIEDVAEENGISPEKAVAALLNQAALRRRRETLDWFARNTSPSPVTSAELIRADRDGR